MKMTKRLLSMLVAAVMVLSMIPAVSAAETEQKATYQAPTKTYTADKWFEAGTPSELRTMLANNQNASDPDNASIVTGVRLTADITFNSENTADKGGSGTLLYASSSSSGRAHNVVVDLNGHTLTTDSTVQLSRLFGAYSGSTMTITNGIIQQSGTFNAYSTCVFFHGGATVILDGVKWTISDHSVKNWYGGMFNMSNSKDSLTVLNSDLTYDCGETGATGRGGMINVSAGATVTLQNSTFTGGRVVGGTDPQNKTWEADGGLLYLTGSAKFSAENCTFAGGEAARHGGLICKGNGTGATSFKGCTFIGGAATGTNSLGGQLYIGTTCPVTIADCTFTGGTSGYLGGQIYKASGSGKLTITGSDFSGGVATEYGGMIYSLGTNAENLIEDCTFTDGEAERGGALHLTNKMTVRDCTITGNHATNHGGGAYVTGNSSNVVFEGLIMDNTSGSQGGSITKYGKGTLTLNNVDITGSSKNGGAMAVCNGTVIFNSGTIHDGEATASSGNIHINRDGTVEGQSLSYGVFIMNGGSVTGGKAQYGGNMRVYMGRAIINGGSVTGGTADSGDNIHVYSKAAAETVSYLETTTVDLYDCLYVFGGKIGGITAGEKHVKLVGGYLAADCSDLLDDHATMATEANAEGYLAVTHNNTDGTDNDIVPTCTDAGTTHVTCTDCTFTSQYTGTVYGGSFTYEAPATGHTPVIDEAVAPDCDSTGLSEGSHCETCGETIVAQEVVPSLGHAYTGVKTEATLESDAYTTYTCSACGDSYIETEEGSRLTAAAQIGAQKYETLAEAFADAQANDTIVLLADVELTGRLTVSKALTLDLNGFDITGNVADVYGMIYVSVKGNLTVVSNAAVVTFSPEGSQITNTAGYAIGNYGTVSVDNITITGADAALYNFYYNASTYGKATIGQNASANILWNSGELTVDGNADYIDNSGALTVTGTAAEIYAQDGSDAAEVPCAGTVTIADTAAVTVPAGYHLVKQTDGAYKVMAMVKPDATVTVLESTTLTQYSIYDGSLTEGTELLPLEVVVNFKAIDTLEDCLAGGYVQWLVDFNITIEGLESGSFVADNCYLAGNYGSYGWIAVPLDGQTIEEGIAYPVVALYDPTLNYKDICQSVKDFTAAIHIDQAILDANPNMTVKLELVMTNPEDAENTLQIGENLVYGYDVLRNGVVAQNKDTGAVYSSLEAALMEAEAGTAVILLGNTAQEEILLFGKTLDLNGYALTADIVVVGNGAHIIDSTEGEGMLIINQEDFVLNHTNNAQLPIFLQEGEVSGFRFMGIELRQSAKLVSKDVAQFRFYIHNGANDCVLQQAMASGGSNSCVYVHVTLDWTDINGNSAAKDYVYSDEMLKLYAAGWDSKEFRLNITGMEYVSELRLTAKLVYMDDQSVSEVPGTTLVLTK